MILEERVRTALAADTRFRDIRHLDQTGSTNDDVAALAAAGAPEGLVVTTDFQTAGRGRLDRRWDARPGDGLLVSVLLRPSGLAPERRSLVASAVALAARDACAAVAGLSTDIKWPNDLMIGEGKLAGILASDSSGAVVVGMGMNVHGGPPGAECLDRAAGRRVTRGLLLESWLRSLDRLADDWDAVAARYCQECATIGRAVRVELSAGEIVTGVASSVDDLGRLVLTAEDGTETALAVGDVTHLR